MESNRAYHSHYNGGSPMSPHNATPRFTTTPAPLQTQSLRNPRFSFEQAPVQQHQHPVYEQFASPTNSVIDESPVSASTFHRMPLPGQEPHSPYAEDKPARTRTPYEERQMHPAHFAPYAEPGAEGQRYSHHSSTTALHDLPRQQSMAYGSAQDKRPSVPPVPDTDPSLDHKPAMSTPRLAPRTPTYNPHAVTGPNVLVGENHIPGQVSHPNAAVDPEWKHGLCEPGGACCMSMVCPCIVYGRTQYRLSQKKNRKEATDLLGYETVNGSCGVMAVACGLQWLFPLIQRTRVRKLYRLNGSFGDDCFKAVCCCCCVLAQNEREVVDRETLLRRNAGPATGAMGYVQEGGMVYDPPPR